MDCTYTICQKNQNKNKNLKIQLAEFLLSNMDVNSIFVMWTLLVLKKWHDDIIKIGQIRNHHKTWR